MSSKVLVVDDEPQIRRALKAGLERSGYRVLLAQSGDEGLRMLACDRPDIIILDLAIPGMDGFEVCGQDRQWSKVPIVVLSVREDEDGKIRALDLGADDYLTKPFALRELLARMRAVLHRLSWDEANAESAFKYETLLIDFTHRSVLVNDIAIDLTPREFELLRYMVLNPNRVLTHRQLLTEVWGAEFVHDLHTLRVHVANLRNKIEKSPERPRLLQTESRIGYRFRADT